MKKHSLRHLVPSLDELSTLEDENQTRADTNRLQDMILYMGLSNVCFLGPPRGSKYL